MTQTPHPVAIVGAGIVGCATAYYLARHGIPCAVYEKGTVNAEQSSRAWGFVRQQGRDPAELPLMVESNRIWQTLERELDANLGWRQAGILYLAYGEQRMNEFQDWIELARQYQLQTRLVSRRELPALLPGIHTDAVGGMFTPNDGHAEPPLVAPAFRRTAEKLGAVFHEHCAVQALYAAGGKIKGIVTEYGPVRADTVVCAAGAWSRALLKSVGLSLPQVWLRGTCTRTTPVRPLTDMAVWSKVAFRQAPDGSLNIAAGGGGDHDILASDFPQSWQFLPDLWEHGRKLSLHLGKPFLESLSRGFRPERQRTLDPAPNPRWEQQALATLRETFPDLGEVKVARSWAGYIDLTPDMLPVIEAVDSPRGLVIATGMSGHGFGFAPVVGRVVADLLDGAEPGFDLEDFRLARFAGWRPRRPRALV